MKKTLVICLGLFFISLHGSEKPYNKELSGRIEEKLAQKFLEAVAVHSAGLKVPQDCPDQPEKDSDSFYIKNSEGQTNPIVNGSEKPLKPFVLGKITGALAQRRRAQRLESTLKRKKKKGHL